MTRVSGLAGPTAVALLAVLLCLPRLGNPPEFDELYHVLAARGWVETGRFAIAEGEYTRAGHFTLLVGALFRALGESVAVARLPSVAAFAALGALFFAWLRARTGRAAAWTASLLLVSSPFMVELGTFARFYAIQILLVLGAVVLIDQASSGTGSARGVAVRAAAAALMLLVAAQTQVTTLIGVLGVAAWLALELLGPRLLAAPPRARLAWAAAVLVAAAAALAFLASTGMLAILLHQFRTAPQFQQDTVNQFWFYHFWLVLYYPALWTIFPALLLLALAAYPRTARLCATVFVVAFVLHSLSGRKDTRYISYAFPFLFAVFGMGLAAAWPGLHRRFTDLLWGVLPEPAPGTARARLEVAALGSILAFVVLANGAVPRLAAMLAGIRVPPQPPLADWRAAAGELAPRLGSADVVVTTNELAALYHLGRYDVVLSPSRLSEVARDGREFARDARTGRPVIGSSEGLRSVLDCFGSGLLVSDRTRLEALSRQGGIGEVLALETRPLPLPRAWSVEARVWEGRGPRRDAALCRDLVARRRTLEEAGGTE